MLCFDTQEDHIAWRGVRRFEPEFRRCLCEGCLNDSNFSKRATVSTSIHTYMQYWTSRTLKVWRTSAMAKLSDSHQNLVNPGTTSYVRTLHVQCRCSDQPAAIESRESTPNVVIVTWWLLNWFTSSKIATEEVLLRLRLRHPHDHGGHHHRWSYIHLNLIWGDSSVRFCCSVCVCQKCVSFVRSSFDTALTGLLSATFCCSLMLLPRVWQTTCYVKFRQVTVIVLILQCSGFWYSELKMRFHL